MKAGNVASEVDAASVLFPIAVTRRLGAVASAQLPGQARVLRHIAFDGLLRCRNGVDGMLGDGRCFAYHDDLATHKILILAPVADNLPLPEPAFFALPDHTLVGLHGTEAAAFAQAQFANDVSQLASGQWQWNAWLTPKGRVIALFALLRRADDDFLLLAPDYPAEVLAAQLARFVFRRKLKIAARPDLHVSGSFSRPMAARGAQAASDGESLELDFGADGGPRTLRISCRWNGCRPSA